MTLHNEKYDIVGRLVKVVKLKDEWFDQIDNLGEAIEEIRMQSVRGDIFTFRQALPNIEKKYNYYSEPESIAAIPITTYDNWFNKQIERGARKSIKKAEKSGVLVKIADFDDALAKGITDIFNETPIRQGRPYTHYGMKCSEVKSQIAKDRHRSDIIAAYCEEELIGFIQLGYAGKSAIPFGMVSKLKHRDKSPQNAMLAKAIQVCAEKEVPYLLYGSWTNDSLNEFKVHNGCIKIDLPRYYIPISIMGRYALKLRLHHGLKEMLPEGVRKKLKGMRKYWYEVNSKK